MGLKRFDYKIKDNTKKRSIIVASIIVLVLLVGIGIYATFAAYKVTKTYNVIQGKVGDFVNADIAITVKVIDADGNETTATDFPSSADYAYVADKSSCTNGSTIEFDETNWQATITSSTKDKCTLCFEYGAAKILSEAILANSNLVTTTPTFNTNATDENANIYQAEDDYGTSYYFRGATTNNYVQFGTYAEDATINWGFDSDLSAYKTINVTAGTPMYWRIVRINGDGTVRLIYDGTEAASNGTEHIISIGVSAFNNQNGATGADNSKYVGYTYANGSGGQTDSLIKGVIDTWYETQLKENYSQYLADSIFCNDRGTPGTSTADFYFNSYTRIVTNKSPILVCQNKDDSYTVNDTENGNGYLTNPIGLITADELIMAGGSTSSNTSYYLYSNAAFWTITPFYYGGSYIDVAYMWLQYETGRVYNTKESKGYISARPVINLNANIKMYGSGTMTDPYRLTKEL